MARSYIYTNKKQSGYGIMSTVFGIMSVVTYILCIVGSYEAAGDITERYAVAALLATVFMITGFVLVIRTFFQTDRFKLFFVFGIIVNSVALLLLSTILYAGAIL